MIAFVLALIAAFLYLLAFFGVSFGGELVTLGHVLLALAVAAMNLSAVRVR